MPEAEVEVDVEEEEDLKQEENVLKEEEDQIYQINLKGGQGPIFTQEKDREIINMVLASNAIRLREIQANIIGGHAIFNTVMSIRSLSQHWHTSSKDIRVKLNNFTVFVLYFQFFSDLFLMEL